VKTILIAYNLAGSSGGDQSLTRAIRDLGKWWHHLDDVWLVKADTTPSDVRDVLRQHLHDGDGLLVIDVTDAPVAWTGFDDSGRKWLAEDF
jgi:hypothetical protein